MLILKKSQEGKRWTKTTLNNFYEAVDITKDIIEEMKIEDRNSEEYTREFALGSLKSGRIIDTPCILFKLGKDEDTKTCPLCGSYYMGMGALSRRDNKTDICPQCGMNEAIEDMRKHKEVNKKSVDAIKNEICKEGK